MPAPVERCAAVVRTLLGDVDAGSLGHCQCHEHLFIERGHPAEVNPALLMEDGDAALCELALYRGAGGKSLVDAQPVGCGRMVAALRDASARSGVHIVASTGFHKLAFYPEGHWIFAFGEDELTGLFLREIETGCVDDYSDGPRPCRAGIVKAALDACGISGRYRALFAAAAASAAKTGAAVLLHVEAGADATEALKYFTLRGVPANALIFCHLDRAEPDIGRHVEIARAGAYLEHDTIARPKYHDDEHEIGLIERILAAGLTDRLLLSLDTTRERLKCYGGAIGLDYILSTFLPKLAARGVGAEQIKRITVDNPAAAMALRRD